ncbi:MAG: hypothetical protein V4713_10620 [Pseudomonadota bacterium]
MDTGLIFALTACFLCAAITYLVLDYRVFGERQKAMETALHDQAEVTATKKKLQGYTKYTDYLAPAKKTVTEQAKLFTAKVVRDHVHVEKVNKEKLKLKSDATFIVKYSVEYVFGMDFKPDSFEIVATTVGIEIRSPRPMLLAAPAIQPQSHETPGIGEVKNEKDVVAEIHLKLSAQAQTDGEIMASEEAVRAVCKMKLMEFLRDFMVKQPGMAQVPVISVVFK